MEDEGYVYVLTDPERMREDSFMVGGFITKEWLGRMMLAKESGKTTWEYDYDNLLSEIQKGMPETKILLFSYCDPTRVLRAVQAKYGNLLCKDKDRGIFGWYRTTYI